MEEREQDVVDDGGVGDVFLATEQGMVSDQDEEQPGDGYRDRAGDLAALLGPAFSPACLTSNESAASTTWHWPPSPSSQYPRADW